MPWASKKQQRWGHSAAGESALGGPAKVAEWDAATNFKRLPAQAGGNMKGVKGYLHRVAAKRAAFAGTEPPREERAEMSKTKRRGIKIRPANKGKLHKALGVPAGQKIPAGKIAAAKNSSSPALRKEATFAQNARSWGHR